MKRTFKAGLLTVCMTALATAPIVTITTLATADAAYAKNGGGNGNGGGNSNAGGNGNGKDKSASARGGASGAKGQGKGKAKGHGQSRSASKGGPKTIGEFFQKLTGQDKKASRTTATRGNSAKQTIPTEITEAPAKRGGKRIAGMHPSQLGNMNAAHNANINAVLAHIRNGNTNGPVGVVAGLAVAKVAAGDAQQAFDIENGYSNLEAEFIGTPYEVGGEYATAEEALAAYLSATDSPRTTEVDTALADLANVPADTDTTALEAALASALADAGYPSDLDDPQQSYLDDVAAAETAVNGDVEGAIDLLVVDESGDFVSRDETITLEEAEAALTDATMSLTGAEVAIIETWNKSDAANEEDTAALLEALHTRITDNEEVIKSTVDATKTETDDGEMGGDDLADCDDGEDCGDDELEEIASAN